MKITGECLRSRLAFICHASPENDIYNTSLNPLVLLNGSDIWPQILSAAACVNNITGLGELPHGLYPCLSLSGT